MEKNLNAKIAKLPKNNEPLEANTMSELLDANEYDNNNNIDASKYDNGAGR
ncbi:MAG: hypothetical protein IKZ17_01395 [Bacteroidaceae bacterium]|nr:hypothetical protein [Bacteroidaceae bacterium]